ncbi:MAG: UDP-N-acetylglucosamine 2-epimerase (non-hydrolyzing) [Candidatus Lokiarchaeota archaeon]|nr:UDP-N-acetylglucosamine 2-epimerase (non-hydrolyzing) [Candidatus Lokiarchaeota archaeon]
MSKKIFLVAGARPNFIKIAPLINELKNSNIEFKLVHTGQHYDYNMSKVFFDDLGIPEPDIHLNVGSASHAVQTANIMIEFEKVILNEKPLLVVVVGDVNSTIACALVAKKLNIKIAHVEAGLRSFDQKMPEETNRILTDQISDFLFTTEYSAEVNLNKEGIDQNKIYFVGNIMIDSLIRNLKRVEDDKNYKKFGLKRGKYALVTIHRPSNVDLKDDLIKIIKMLNYTQEKIKVFFPIHPRTKKNLKKFNLENTLKNSNIILSEPIGYLDFLNLMMNSKFIVTDSGGIQEEASYLKIPVLTLRENTERPITIEKGTNEIIGDNYEKFKNYIDEIISDKYKNGQDIEKWDGNTAKRIIEIIKENLF